MNMELDDDYQCKVMKVSRNINLKAFQYFLKKDDGLTERLFRSPLVNSLFWSLIKCLMLALVKLNHIRHPA